MVTQLFLLWFVTKRAHFVPCHKEITVEESTLFFIDHCYRLHCVPRVIVSAADPKFLGKFWQTFMGKINTKLNMSIARHPCTHGLTERAHQTMQTLLRFYYAKSGFDWTSHLSMVILFYFSINQATSNSPFEAMYAFQPSKHANRHLPLIGATAEAANRLTMITHGY